MKKRLMLLAASLALLLATTAALAQESVDEVRCLLPEGCGPVDVETSFFAFSQRDVT